MYLAPIDNDPIHSQEQADIEFTRRQLEVLYLVAHGLTTKEIASHMNLSVHTIDTHLHKIYVKLKITNRAAAIRYAIEHGLD